MQRKKKIWLHHNIVFFCWECQIRKKMTKMKIYLHHKSVILWWKCDGHIFVERMSLCFLNTKSWLCDGFVIRMSHQEKDDKTKITFIPQKRNFVTEMWWTYICEENLTLSFEHKIMILWWFCDSKSLMWNVAILW